MMGISKDRGGSVESARMKSLWQSALSALRGRSDEEAMWRVKVSDDHDEFTWLVRKWEAPVHRLCTRLTGDLGRAEELKQETFLKLFQSRKAYQPTARFSTFLWRIALNLCHDEFRRQDRRRTSIALSGDGDASSPEIQASEAASEAPGPDVTVAHREENELVRDAVLELPEIYRTAVVLRHYENLKLSQIAEVLQIPEGTVNSRLAEALTRLNRILEPKLRSQRVHQSHVSPLLALQKSVVL